MSKTTARKRIRTLTQFVAHPREMRESWAWRKLPDNARRILDRLELEHMRHGGAENGSLPCTYSDFVKAGVRRASVSRAIRECVALGFLEITFRGGRAFAQFRPPSRYRLTYLNGTGKTPAPTHDWKNFASAEAADGALATAAAERSQASQPSRRVAKAKIAGRAIASGAGRASASAVEA
jgi:hypothetical protein